MLDVVPVSTGDICRIGLESTNSAWRQGIWIGTQGLLRVNDVESAQIVIWRDSAPASVDIEVIESDGNLRVYNIWDSGRGIKDHESQSMTSGMIIDVLNDGTRRYRCNDIGYEPDFDKLVFTLQVL